MVAVSNVACDARITEGGMEPPALLKAGGIVEEYAAVRFRAPRDLKLGRRRGEWKDGMADIRHRQYMRLLLLVVLAAAGLMQSSGGWAQRSTLQGEISQHEQKLAAAREAKSVREEATELNVLGTLYRQAGKMQKALERLNEALPMERDAGNQAAQAMTENTMGRVYTEIGRAHV